MARDPKIKINGSKYEYRSIYSLAIINISFYRHWFLIFDVVLICDLFGGDHALRSPLPQKRVVSLVAHQVDREHRREISAFATCMSSSSSEPLNVSAARARSGHHLQCCGLRAISCKWHVVIDPLTVMPLQAYTCVLLSSILSKPRHTTMNLGDGLRSCHRRRGTVC